MDDYENNGFGPISDKRGKRAEKCAWFLVIASITAALSFRHEKFGIELLLLSIVAAIYGEMIKNACLFVEEMFHVSKRYNGSIFKAFDACFSHPKWKVYILFATVCLGAVWYYCMSSHSPLDSHSLTLLIMQLWLAPLISYLLGLKTANQAEVSEMNEIATKNVADGLAWSFYYGYLKLIVPSIMEVINLSENEVDGLPVRDHINHHKLFIVIPKDCNCASNFAEVDRNIEFVSETHERIISRAGNQRRVYKNSIYKVRSSANETFYCLMEYATPLLSMFEMQNDARCSFTREDRDNQVVLFYRRLKEILEKDERCRGKYHLVLTSNARTDLADIMAKEIMKSRSAV